jgi:hypothetical protein
MALGRDPRTTQCGRVGHARRVLLVIVLPCGSVAGCGPSAPSLREGPDWNTSAIFITG